MVTMATMEVAGYMRKLEVVHKEVGGCLISYILQLACVRKLEVIWPDARALPRQPLWMMNGESVNPSYRYRAARAAKNLLPSSPQCQFEKSQIQRLRQHVVSAILGARSLTLLHCHWMELVVGGSSMLSHLLSDWTWILYHQQFISCKSRESFFFFSVLFKIRLES